MDSNIKSTSNENTFTAMVPRCRKVVERHLTPTNVQVFVTVLIFVGLYVVYEMSIAQDSNQLDVKTCPRKQPKEVNWVKSHSFLIKNDFCQIPRMPLWDAETRPLFKKRSFEGCTPGVPLLTYVVAENNQTKLVIDYNAMKKYNTASVNCSVSNIIRKTDYIISLSESTYFKNEIDLNGEFFFVNCTDPRTGKSVFTNAYAIPRKNFRTNGQHFLYKQYRAMRNNTDPHVSVLLVGVDSMSRMQLHRSFPKTAAFMQKSGWVELKGYNKVGSNTYPNFCAALLGMNETAVKAKCFSTGGLLNEKCNFIWKQFSSYGYVTVFGEDNKNVNTFHHRSRRGFAQPPVDMYLRPWVVASEKLLVVKEKHKMRYCIGPEQSSLRILDYAKNFSLVFKDQPYFALFWMTSFSHNDFSEPRCMDGQYKEFFELLAAKNVTDNTIIVFFSDHGLRFGPIVNTNSGWYEERLPMFSIWLPEWYRKKYFRKYANLLDNALKLTTPFDLYMTLRDILHTEIPEARNDVQKPEWGSSGSESFPESKSLFSDDIPVDRSCRMAGVDAHLCTCQVFETDGHQLNATMRAVVPYVVHRLNETVSKAVYPPGEHKRCAHLRLGTLHGIMVSKSLAGPNKTTHTLLHVKVTTLPGEAFFDATVAFKYENVTEKGANGTNTTVKERPVFELVGEPSRINEYGHQSDCVAEESLKKYCYCVRKYCYWYEWILGMCLHHE